MVTVIHKCSDRVIAVEEVYSFRLCIMFYGIFSPTRLQFCACEALVELGIEAIKPTGMGLSRKK